MDILPALGDAIPYTLPTLLALLAHFNAALWPLQSLLLPLLLGIALFPDGNHPAWRRLQPWLITLGWLSCGMLYQLSFAAMLDWTARYTAWLLVFEGCLVAVAGWSGRHGAAPLVPARVGAKVLMLSALVLVPLAQWLVGTPLRALFTAGLLPGVTALFTAGWLLAVRGRWWLWPIPLGWMFLEFAMGLGLGYIPAMLPLPLTMLVLLLQGLRRRETDVPRS